MGSDKGWLASRKKENKEEGSAGGASKEPSWSSAFPGYKQRLTRDEERFENVQHRTFNVEFLMNTPPSLPPPLCFKKS
ncbi:MAG: hypothetical protein PF692_10630, partial [Kiritimatiellae bacterium]|nr:hypothetical protein [Kiritimatiellia bacterium]